ncbi:MAG TPA: RDD family protein [Dehalococcoidales bacterium]|nr:RDD family protein [Dehalococcoidales bacterium]
MKCRVCGQDNPPEAGFCANCGATLAAAVAQPPPEVAAVKYAGLWMRFQAAFVDGVIVSIISGTLSVLPVGYLSWLPFTWLYFWLFTGLKGQTPGKMIVRIKVVNARGDVPGLAAAFLREIIGKSLSSLALGLGYLWIAFHKEKQGWHDIIASTRVVEVAGVKSKD